MTALRALLLENIHSRSHELLKACGVTINALKHSPSDDELERLFASAEIVGIRSKTKVHSKFFKRNPQLLVMGAFCIGTDQIDLHAAEMAGVPVFNAPYSNTRSVAELVLAEIIILSRRLGDVNTQAHQGVWQKSAEDLHEVRGKTLGIIGYGHIGSQVSVLAEALGLKVVFFDIVKKLPLGNSQSRAQLGEVLREADFVTLHVPDTPQTHHMLGTRELGLMKRGAYLINASRGSVVDISALASVLRSGHLLGAAVDVFPVEPASNEEKFKSELQGIKNVFLTPHIGGSTMEAQEAIGVEVAHSLSGYILSGSTRGAVNFPQLDLPWSQGRVERLVNVHANVPGVLREINSIVSQSGANILAQALATDINIGYLILDMEHGSAREVKDKIDALKTSIKTRALVRPEL